MTARVSIGELAARTLRLAVPIYLATLVLALVPAFVGMAGLAAVAGDRPWRSELLGPNWLNTVLEILGGTIYSGGSVGVGAILLAGLLLVPLAQFGQLVAYSLLAGGILEQLAGGAETGRSFWAGCRSWFWPSLRLSILGSAIVLLIGLIFGAGLALFSWWVSADAAALVLMGAQAIVLGWLELARAIVVREESRSVGAALVRASRALARPPVLVLWLLLALPSAGLILAALGPPAVADAYAVSDLLLALGYGQLVAFLLAWTKVIRLAVAIGVAETLTLPGSVPSASRGIRV